MEAAIPSRPTSDASISALGAHPVDHPRRHRLDALATSAQHQPLPIPACRLAPIRMGSHAYHYVAVAFKTGLDMFRHVNLAQYLKISIYYHVL